MLFEKYLVKQIGGAQKTTNISGNLMILVILTLSLLIRALIVQYSYNAVAPTFIKNMGGSLQSYSAITFVDALLLVLLVSSLI